jgi:hypothetical protein
MTFHPLDPTGGFHIHEETDASATVELADGLLLRACKVSWNAGRSFELTLSYAYRQIVGRRNPDGSSSSFSYAYTWATSHRTLGTIPLQPAKDKGFGEAVRLSLLAAFGADAQARMRAVMTLARLRQDIMGWADADLEIDEQYPRGILRTQRGSQKLSTILLKADRGRRPPDLHAFLGPACLLRADVRPKDIMRIFRRPEKAADRLHLPTGHSRLAAVFDLITVFAAHGIDLSPWQSDLLA